LLHVRGAADAWEKTWDERRLALERLFGKASEHVLHAAVPFELGGQADVLVFPNHVVGATLYVTADLTGDDSGQVANSRWEQYELAICVRGDDPWPPNTISRLATYSLGTPLEPGETMDIAPAVPQPSAITAFLFAEYGDFRLQGRRCGVLLCIGITAEELQDCFDLGSTAVLERLRGTGVFPFTDLAREPLTGGAA
jgi:hypothetical protein